ncbi:hypothetical protein [Clostridium botulinum]|uniref:hypothetical protein n=1 Tax=Clostridium botulinum TaxID=1491 RepID=UPI0002074F8B|nr:hypothetical protein [Clostridium botulinum]AEB75792.1 hypothetical protein CbC4_1112 [Clostridium botulinum BKT015925]KEH98584.1 hypothetical protein Z953_12895 [Clostridium botulinum D str. 16868]KEI05752.1 hypothetical protein Y848_03450 [Clostridium botulinum C/D str. Sp77]
MGYPKQNICVKPVRCNGGGRGFYILNKIYDRKEVFFKEKYKPICSLNELLLKLQGLDNIPRILIMEYIDGE